MRRLAFVLLAACAGSHAQPATTTTSSSSDPPTTITSPCNADLECVVTDFAGCCEACPIAPHAMARRDLERQQRTCTEIDCTARGRTRCEPTERPDAYKAVCRDHTCAMGKK